MTNINSRTISSIIGMTGLLGLYFVPYSFIFAASNHTFCIHKILFGFDCPGCGMTRSLYSFIHLDILKAVILNPAILFFVPILFIELLLSIAPLSKHLLGLQKILFLLFTTILIENYIYKIPYLD